MSLLARVRAAPRLASRANTTAARAARAHGGPRRRPPRGDARDHQGVAPALGVSGNDTGRISRGCWRYPLTPVVPSAGAVHKRSVLEQTGWNIRGRVLSGADDRGSGQRERVSPDRGESELVGHRRRDRRAAPLHGCPVRQSPSVVLITAQRQYRCRQRRRVLSGLLLCDRSCLCAMAYQPYTPREHRHQDDDDQSDQKELYCHGRSMFLSRSSVFHFLLRL